MGIMTTLKKPTPEREGIGGYVSNAFVMDTAAIGVAPKEDEE